MILDGKLKGKRPFRKTGSTSEDSINMNLKKYQGVGGMDYFGSGKGQVAGCNEPAGPIKKQ
jgi:hypothetical protein